MDRRNSFTIGLLRKRGVTGFPIQQKIGCFCYLFNFIFKNNPAYSWMGKLFSMVSQYWAYLDSSEFFYKRVRDVNNDNLVLFSVGRPLTFIRICRVLWPFVIARTSNFQKRFYEDIWNTSRPSNDDRFIVFKTILF